MIQLVNQAWHDEQRYKTQQSDKEKQFLGIHATHELERVQSQSGPHVGKLICKTCKNKFLKWLPREAF